MTICNQFPTSAFRIVIMHENFIDPTNDRALCLIIWFVLLKYSLRYCKILKVFPDTLKRKIHNRKSGIHGLHGDWPSNMGCFIETTDFHPSCTIYERSFFMKISTCYILKVINNFAIYFTRLVSVVGIC